MPFVKGRSGNPKGRPRRTDTEKRQREQIRKALPGIVERLIASANGGDTTAAKLLLERVMPALRPIDQAVTVPVGPDLGTAAESVLAAVGAGTLTPDQALKMANTIASLAKTKELIEIENRIINLEELLNDPQVP